MRRRWWWFGVSPWVLCCWILHPCVTQVYLPWLRNKDLRIYQKIYTWLFQQVWQFLHTWMLRNWRHLSAVKGVSRFGSMSKTGFSFVSELVWWSLKNSSANGSPHFLFFDDASNSVWTSVLGLSGASAFWSETITPSKIGFTPSTLPLCACLSFISCSIRLRCI